MSLARLVTGQMLQGTYNLERLLGEGGHGAVYEASHKRLNRRFAVKLLRGDIGDEALQRFEREAMVTSTLEHPNIIDVTDFNYSDGAPFLVMELLTGEDLEHRLKRVGRLTLTEAMPLLAQITAALGYAHDKGVVHRDLKPQNIFLAEKADIGEVVKVLDFGISKMVGLDTLTTPGSLLGTPFYMAPEQVDEDAEGISFLTDVYSLGAIAYQMLTGQPPLVSDRMTAMLYKIIRTVPEPAASVADVPPAVSDVIATALAKVPEERFTSVRAFFAAMQEASGINVPLVAAGVSGEVRLPVSERVPAGALDRTQPPVFKGAGPTLPPSSDSSVNVGMAATVPDAVGVVTLPPAEPSRRWVLPLVAVVGLLLGVGIVAVVVLSGGSDHHAGNARDAATPADAAVVAARALPDAEGLSDLAAAGPVDVAKAAVAVDLGGKQKPRRSRRPRRPGWRASPALPPQTCSLAIMVRLGGSPTPAKVFIDDKAVGESPVFRRAIACGAHAVRALKDGWPAASRQVSLEPERDNRLMLNLDGKALFRAVKR